MERKLALSERQIVQYSRQILLAQVGGVGQEKLLGTRASLTGEGSAQAVAATYLAAGGTPIAVDRPLAPSSEVGFLVEERSIGAVSRAAAGFEAALRDLNPDALAEPAARGCLGEAPALFSGSAPWVALGWSEGKGAILYRSEAGCAQCFQATLQPLGAGSPGPRSVLLGALAALAFQRLLLGLAEPLGGLCVGKDLTFSPLTLARCAEHGAPI